MHFVSSSQASSDDDNHHHHHFESKDILFLSAADTDLLVFSQAYEKLCKDYPKKSLFSIGVVNLMELQSQHDIDHFVEDILPETRFIICRILGGISYWSYGVELLCSSLSRLASPPILLFLPADDKSGEASDTVLRDKSSIPSKDWFLLSQYCMEGGILNYRNFLARIFSLLEENIEIPYGQPIPVENAGVYEHDLVSEDFRGKACVLLLFYRALILSGQTSSIDELISSLYDHNLRAIPLYITGLRDSESCKLISSKLLSDSPGAVITSTSFSAGNESPLVTSSAPVFQTINSSSSFDQWQSNPHGVDPTALTMQVAMTEIDGHVLGYLVSSKEQSTSQGLKSISPVSDGIKATASLASRAIDNSFTSNKDRRVTMIMAHYPSRESRMANGVGLDTPASIFNMIRVLSEQGYKVDLKSLPDNSDKLISCFQGVEPSARIDFLLEDYLRLTEQHFSKDLFLQTSARWGEPHKDITFDTNKGCFRLPILYLGNVILALQPSRGYHLDPHETYHSPDLVPPHAYIAFYLWIRFVFETQTIVHFGKHGNLEWLPGKALALGEDCWPRALIGDTPHVYPFIVNDPGEGAQAKRRTHAVIVDHLTPPLERAESHGDYAILENLLDEYFHASIMDKKRANILEKKIIDIAYKIGLDKECSLTSKPESQYINEIDAYLCTIKETQIRTGLHIFGQTPRGDQRVHLLSSIARSARGSNVGDESILRAISKDLSLGDEFDPLSPITANAWQGDRPELLEKICSDPWRHDGDTIERIELLAMKLIKNDIKASEVGVHTQNVMESLSRVVFPSFDSCGAAEQDNFLAALSGDKIVSGPAGAPTRGRPEVLPTGKNFFSLDPRIMPTLSAWELGQKSAEALLARYLDTHGFYPKKLALSAWGTANMRTGGDDVAQMLALLGVKPKWDSSSLRVTGFEIIPLSKLNRPRVDITLRISGFFRDAFSHLISYLDDAIRAVASLEESETDNPLAHSASIEAVELSNEGVPIQEALWLAQSRIFGSKPGAYGAGLQTLIDNDAWEDHHQLAKAFLQWSSYIYASPKSIPANGKKYDHYGRKNIKALSKVLKQVQLVIHNQDNREHDLLDSDDYYQFEGGLATSIRSLSGKKPTIYHMDHSRTDYPKAYTLSEEIGRVVRARVTNPKWIDAMKRHGHKGGFEMAATVTYLVAFAVTTEEVDNSHFDLVFNAFLEDQKVVSFLKNHNPDALREICEKLLLALERGLWQSRSNHARGVFEETIASLK